MSCGVYCTACMYVCTCMYSCCTGFLLRWFKYLKHHWIASSRCVDWGEPEPFFPFPLPSHPVTGILAASVPFIRTPCNNRTSPPYAYTVIPGHLSNHVHLDSPELSVFKTCDCWYMSTMQLLVRSITDRRSDRELRIRGRLIG